MISVKIRNFQSIEHLDMEIAGFTVLTGRSNIGKSAVLRAISCALGSNNTGNWFVRHTEDCPRKKGRKTCKCFSSVELQVNGHTILWEKGEGTNRYTVNGALYDKAERGYPPFLEPLNLGPISLGDSKELVQFSSQWNPLFLFGRSPSEIASVIGDVGDLPKIQEATKASEKDRKNAVATLKVREADLESVAIQLEAYQDLPDMEATLVRLEEKDKEVQNLRSKISSLLAFKSKMEGLRRAVLDLDSALATPTPSLESCSTHWKRVRSCGSLIERHGILSGSLASLGLSLGVQVPESLPDTSRLKRLLIFKKGVSSLSSQVEVPSVTVSPLPSPVRYQTLLSFAAKRTEKVQGLDLSERHCASLEVEAAQLSEEIATLSVRSESVCPACGQELEGSCHT